MAVLSKEDFLNLIKERTKDSTDDDTLKFVEDATDTINSLSDTDAEDWKTKYEDNDKMWRQKYKDRFFSAGDSAGNNHKTKTNDDDDDDDDDDDAKNKEIVAENFDELFK